MERINRRIAPKFITELSQCEIFVFGSNLEGQHAGGAARIAHEKFGAVWGVGVGPTGRSYAIPTMHGGVDAIKPYVDQFVEYAKTHPLNRFLLTRIGCGIAGFTDREMAPLFRNVLALPNVAIPAAWVPYIDSNDVIHPEIETPEVVTDDMLKWLCEKHRYAIGAGMRHFVPDVRVRYVCGTDEFGYTSLYNCFFFGDGGMYVWEKDERWASDHNQDVVEGVFHDECEGRGYAHRVICAGVATGFEDVVGEEIYTGDVIEIEQDHRRCRLAVCALDCGYGFKLGDTERLLSDCRGKKLKRVGTVFYQLDWNEYPVTTVTERVMAFNNVNDNNEQHKLKMAMARFTPNFDQEPWKYTGLDILGAQFHCNK
jgi:hypothetical protein